MRVSEQQPITTSSCWLEIDDATLMALLRKHGQDINDLAEVERGGETEGLDDADLAAGPQPLVYFAVGSSGNRNLVLDVLRGLGRADCQVLAPVRSHLHQEGLEVLGYEGDDPVSPLHCATHDESTGAPADTAVAAPHAGSANNVEQTGLVLQVEEDHAGSRVGPLPVGDDAGDAHSAPMLLIHQVGCAENAVGGQ